MPPRQRPGKSQFAHPLGQQVRYPGKVQPVDHRGVDPVQLGLVEAGRGAAEVGQIELLGQCGGTFDDVFEGSFPQENLSRRAVDEAAALAIGGLIFGISLFRARILARWAAALLAVGTIATASLAVLPESLNRPMAVPVGLALIGLGVSLWRNPSAPAVVTTVETARIEHATA